MSDHPIERERRWLVKEFDLEIIERASNVLTITQGYFDVLGERSFRVRMMRDMEGERAVVALKEGVGEVRTERELPIALDAARMMLDATPYKINKVRFCIDGFELDRFGGPLKGIVLLEYEAKGDEPFPELPSWVKSAVDVTDSLTNLHLARMAKEIDGDVSDHVALFLELKLPKIVLTGGPCSGKSTLMREIETKYGYCVHCVPEVATILISQVGIHPDANDEKHNARFQKILYRVQRSFEEAAELQALKDGKKVIVVDRGTLDVVAFMHGEEAWSRFRFKNVDGKTWDEKRIATMETLKSFLSS